MFNHHDINRDVCMLHRPILAHHGYDWWWHSFTAQDADTGEDKPFFIEFFICNPALAEDEPVLGQLPENKAAGKRPSYLMVKAGTWGIEHFQLHRFFSLHDTRICDNAPYEIEAADCYASETALRGSVSISPEEAAAHPEWMCDAGALSWNLKVNKQIAFNVGYGASKPLRDADAFAMYWHAEGMKTAYQGEITCWQSYRLPLVGKREGPSQLSAEFRRGIDTNTLATSFGNHAFRWTAFAVTLDIAMIGRDDHYPSKLINFFGNSF